MPIYVIIKHIFFNNRGGELVKGKYERIEITFNKDDEYEIELYNYIIKNSNKIGKAKWIKNLVRKEMSKDRE